MSISSIGKQTTVQQPSAAKRAVKKAAIVATVAAAATAGTIVLAKTGKLNPAVGGGKKNYLVEKTKAHLKKYAQDTERNIKNIPTLVADGFAAVKNKVISIFDTIESKANSAKFNPDLADAADKAAETFNNFVKQ